MEDNKIKNVGNLSKLKKQSKDSIIEELRNVFPVLQGKEAIENKIIKNNNTLFEKPVRITNFYIKIYIGYESNSDKNKMLSFREYFEKMKLSLKRIRDILKTSDK